MTTDLFTLKIRGYLREARKRKNQRDFYNAGVLYQRAARLAPKINRSPQRYEEQALDCFEKEIHRSLSTEDYSHAANALERIAKIHEAKGDTQLATDLRLQASYLRLKGIETLIE